MTKLFEPTQTLCRGLTPHLLPLMLLAMAGGLTLTQAAEPAEARAIVRAKPVRARAAAVPAPPKPVISLPPAEPFPTATTSKEELAVAGLRASVVSLDRDVILPQGGSAFVTVKIIETGGNGVVALLAEAESGEVRTILGRGVRSVPAEGGLSAEIPLNTPGDHSVTVEFALKTGSPGPDGKPRSRVRLTLLPQKGGRDATVLAWPLADCAGNYKAELAKIIGDRRERMMSTLTAVSAPEAGISQAWIFPPATPRLAVCRTPKGKKTAACGTASIEGDSNALQAAHIFALANAIVAQKGALPQFQRHTQPLRQASFTLLNSLRLYMEQDLHPALCNGVDYMMDYYQSRTSLLKTTIDDTKQAADAAHTLAATRVAAFSGSAVRPDSAKAEDLTNEVAAALLSPDDKAAVLSDPSLWSKLHTLRAALDGGKVQDLAADRRAAAFAALGMIEATEYLDLAVAKYARLDDTIYGTIRAIIEAHKHACVCGG